MHERNDKRIQARHLMMALIDGEITDRERAELEALLQQFPELNKELDELKSTKELTMNLNIKEPPAHVWKSYWMKVYNRIERGLGWILFSIGAIVLLIYAAVEWINALIGDTRIEWWIKAAIFCLAAGVIILLVSVIREKLFLHKSERYKDIQR